MFDIRYASKEDLDQLNREGREWREKHRALIDELNRREQEIPVRNVAERVGNRPEQQELEL